jgi:hypothetical protein
MEPPGPAEPHDLRQLRIGLLRQAVEIYLALAYPSGDLPEAVRRRLEWYPGVDAEALLSKPPFERTGPPGAAPVPIFALRLGNTHYPHMKLQIQPWPNAAGFMLSVNTHDQVLALDPNSPDIQAFRVLQAENQRIKEAIEHAWDVAGLPIFLRYLRDYIENRQSETPQPSAADPPPVPPH